MSRYFKSVDKPCCVILPFFQKNMVSQPTKHCMREGLAKTIRQNTAWYVKYYLLLAMETCLWPKELIVPNKSSATWPSKVY